MVKSTKLLLIKQRFLSIALYLPYEAILLLIIFSWLYWQTLPPGISSWIIEGWDSAVLQITGSSWGIPHSPGYPLYTILSNLFVRFIGLIPGFSDTPVVWRVSFWSTTTSLLVLIFTYMTTRRLARNRGAAFLAVGLLGVSFVFWRGAIMAEVYSLNALIFVLTYWLALVWNDDPRDRWLIALGLVLGAGMAHHRTAFILPPTVALWVMLKHLPNPSESKSENKWGLILRQWLILGGVSLIPLLSYLYLPWAAQNQVGQSWIYADTSDWNTFWFVVLTREWWGLVDIPTNGADLLNGLTELVHQQATQITIGGVVGGLAGLAVMRRCLWLFAPPFLALVFFGLSYKVADLDSMLIPLTLTLCIGLGRLTGFLIRRLTVRLIILMRVKDDAFRAGWLSPALRWIFSVGVIVTSYFILRPMAEANYEAVDLSGDWQAVDLVEEVVAIGGAGVPLTIIGQDNSVLPDFIYSKVVLGQPVEPLSTTSLSRMPEAVSTALLADRLEQGRRILVDIETLDLDFIPWLSNAVDSGKIFLAPTGHPYLWELLPRPISNLLPENESWQQIPPNQFLAGQVSIVAYNQRIIHKRTGCFLRLTLFWRMEQQLTEDYYVSVQPLGGETVLDKNDHLALMRGYLPTSQVRPGEIIRDELDMIIRQPSALPGVMLVVNLYQIEGDQFPTFGEVTLPITVDPSGCQGSLHY